MAVDLETRNIFPRRRARHVSPPDIEAHSLASRAFQGKGSCCVQEILWARREPFISTKPKSSLDAAPIPLRQHLWQLRAQSFSQQTQAKAPFFPEKNGFLQISRPRADCGREGLRRKEVGICVHFAVAPVRVMSISSRIAAHERPLLARKERPVCVRRDVPQSAQTRKHDFFFVSSFY